MDFEWCNDVIFDEYVEMIWFKIFVLVGVVFEMGVIVGRVLEIDCSVFY